jgi:hypothetical protein
LGLSGKVKTGYSDTSANAISKIKAEQLDFIISQGIHAGLPAAMMLVNATASV